MIIDDKISAERANGKNLKETLNSNSKLRNQIKRNLLDKVEEYFSKKLEWIYSEDMTTRKLTKELFMEYAKNINKELKMQDYELFVAGEGFIDHIAHCYDYAKHYLSKDILDFIEKDR